MLRFSIRRTVAIVAVLLSCIPVVAAKEKLFSEYQIKLPMTARQPILVANILSQPGKEIVFIGMDEQQQRWLLIYGFDSEGRQFNLLDKTELSDSMLAYDIGEKDSRGLEHFYVLNKDNVAVFQASVEGKASQFVPVKEVRSMYKVQATPLMRRINFAQDIDGDKQDDFVLPGFSSASVWPSQGEVNEQTLPIEPRAEMSRGGVTYQDTPRFFIDFNQDGLLDIASVELGYLSVFYQKASGGFVEQEKQIVIPQGIHNLNWWDIREADGQNRDQSNLVHKVVETIKDINGDEIPDLVVWFTQSSGVLERQNDYQFYFGRLIDGDIKYAKEPDTAISNETALTGLNLIDINQDGKVEVLVSSFDIGISEIIGALLSGSVDQQVLVFSLNDQDEYETRPVLNRDVELRFSISKGRGGAPLVLVGDVNGDESDDVILSNGKKSLNVILSGSKRRVFNKKPVKFKTLIPEDAESAIAEDITDDGKADILMSFGRLDDAEHANIVKVLVAN